MDTSKYSKAQNYRVRVSNSRASGGATGEFNKSQPRIFSAEEELELFSALTQARRNKFKAYSSNPFTLYPLRNMCDQIFRDFESRECLDINYSVNPNRLKLLFPEIGARFERDYSDIESSDRPYPTKIWQLLKLRKKTLKDIVLPKFEEEIERVIDAFESRHALPSKNDYLRIKKLMRIFSLNDDYVPRLENEICDFSRLKLKDLKRIPSENLSERADFEKKLQFCERAYSQCLIKQGQYISLRNKIVEPYMASSVSVAYQNRNKGISFEDLKGIADLHLLQTIVEKYDPSINPGKFMDYIFISQKNHFIVQFVKQQKCVAVSKTQNKKNGEFLKAKLKLEREGRDLSDDNLCEVLNWSQKKLDFFRQGIVRELYIDHIGRKNIGFYKFDIRDPRAESFIYNSYERKEFLEYLKKAFRELDIKSMHLERFRVYLDALENGDPIFKHMMDILKISGGSAEHSIEKVCDLINKKLRLQGINSAVDFGLGID